MGSQRIQHDLVTEQPPKGLMRKFERPPEGAVAPQFSCKNCCPKTGMSSVFETQPGDASGKEDNTHLRVYINMERQR